VSKKAPGFNPGGKTIRHELVKVGDWGGGDHLRKGLRPTKKKRKANEPSRIDRGKHLKNSRKERNRNPPHESGRRLRGAWK